MDHIMTQNTIQPYVRWMIRRDLDEVLAIDQVSYVEPYDEQTITGILSKRNYIGMVCEVDDQLVGFMIYALLPDRMLLDRFAVHPEFRRCGVGTEMIMKLQSKCSCNKRQKIELVTSDRNLISHLFLRKNLFVASYVYRDYFSLGHDAYEFQYALDC